MIRNLFRQKIPARQIKRFQSKKGRKILEKFVKQFNIGDFASFDHFIHAMSESRICPFVIISRKANVPMAKLIQRSSKRLLKSFYDDLIRLAPMIENLEGIITSNLVSSSMISYAWNLVEDIMGEERAHDPRITRAMDFVQIEGGGLVRDVVRENYDSVNEKLCEFNKMYEDDGDDDDFSNSLLEGIKEKFPERMAIINTIVNKTSSNHTLEATIPRKVRRAVEQGVKFESNDRESIARRKQSRRRKQRETQRKEVTETSIEMTPAERKRAKRRRQKKRQRERRRERKTEEVSAD